MKLFRSAYDAYEWMERACDRPVVSERVHGAFSFLAADRLGMTARFTLGNGLLCRSEEWRRR